MKKEMNRREFFMHSAKIAGALAAAGIPAIGQTIQPPDTAALAVVQGDSPQKMLEKALELLGGIGRYVRRGDKVVILPNPQGNRPGVSTNPALVSEVIKLCLDAGAAEVSVSSIHSEGRWYSSGISEAIEKSGAKLHYPRDKKDWMDVSIKEAKSLKRASIVRKAVENDVFINLPIAKQHDSSKITCTLKNLMGFNADNNYFHQGDAHLHQCIADLATLFSPKLLIVDAINILGENGPFGPGRLVSPKKVLAGTDMVAMDAYCCRFLKLDPKRVEHIVSSQAFGIGTYDLAGIKIKETTV